MLTDDPSDEPPLLEDDASDATPDDGPDHGADDGASEEADPAEPAPPSAADRLDHPDAAAWLAGLDELTLTHFTTDAVRAARAVSDAAWLTRLDHLRLALLLRNARPLLALCLQARFELAMGQARPDVAAESARTLWGVRELLDQPWKAHAAMLLLAEAQEAAGRPAEAEVTLTRGIAAAQKLAPMGNVVPASAAAARTLTALGRLLARQGRIAEAVGWLEGAVDLAPDDQTAAPARAALATLSPG